MRGVTGAVGLAWRAAVHGWGPSRNQRGWQGCRQPSCLRQPHHTRGPQSSSLGCSNAMTGGVEGGGTRWDTGQASAAHSSFAFLLRSCIKSRAAAWVCPPAQSAGFWHFSESLLAFEK